jgi:hypothetical protein
MDPCGKTVSAETTKAAWEDDCEMEDEYDFSDSIPKPYLRRFQELNLVSLDADVKAAFPDSRSVNEALWLLIKAAKGAHELQKAS